MGCELVQRVTRIEKITRKRLTESASLRTSGLTITSMVDRVWATPGVAKPTTAAMATTTTSSVANGRLRGRVKRICDCRDQHQGQDFPVNIVQVAKKYRLESVDGIRRSGAGSIRILILARLLSGQRPAQLPTIYTL